MKICGTNICLFLDLIKKTSNQWEKGRKLKGFGKKLRIKDIILLFTRKENEVFFCSFFFGLKWTNQGNKILIVIITFCFLLFEKVLKMTECFLTNQNCFGKCFSLNSINSTTFINELGKLTIKAIWNVKLWKCPSSVNITSHPLKMQKWTLFLSI